MAPLGPFGLEPRVAAAVSGGADSMALALSADGWVRARGGFLLALVVDHGLRASSRDEAVLTLKRLSSRNLAGRLLPLSGLAHGSALAARARVARYAALADACASAGILHLLLGHHMGDQAETVLMRRQSGSGAAGQAAMPALAEHAGLRVLRPLLRVPPARLRATLRQAGMAWVEDPSNVDARTLRARLRSALADPDGTGPEVAALGEAARTAGLARAARDAEIADILAERVVLRPEGFALLRPAGPGREDAIDPEALATVLLALSGAPYAPSIRSIAALADAPRPATLAGVRIVPAGHLGPGLLLAREERALGRLVPARPGVIWDGRFRMAADATPPEGATIGALGADAVRFRRQSELPSVVLRTLPAVRRSNLLVAVPHLSYPDPDVCAALRLGFHPRRPAAGPPFLPA